MDYEDEGVDLQEEDEATSDWVHANPPSSMNNLRACIPCMLVKTFAQFREEGCENCSKAFELKEDDNKIAEVTTASFEGLVALTQPPKSWVARWQFVQNFVPGVYALKVKGDVSEMTASELEDAHLPNVGKMLQQEILKRSEKKGH